MNLFSGFGYSVFLYTALIFCFAAKAQQIPLSSTTYSVLTLSGNRTLQSSNGFITLDAYFDLACSDTKEAWPTYKELFLEYGENLLIRFHLMPLPYHQYAFLLAKSANAIALIKGDPSFHTIPNELREKWNSQAEEHLSLKSTEISTKYVESTTKFPLRASSLSDITTRNVFEFFDIAFRKQNEILNSATVTMSYEEVYETIVKKWVQSIPSIDMEKFESQMFDYDEAESQTRYQFKYSTLNGVFGTPIVFINGLMTENLDQTSLQSWSNYLNPLLMSLQLDDFDVNMVTIASPNQEEKAIDTPSSYSNRKNANFRFRH